jgi:hypothetical protein
MQHLKDEILRRHNDKFFGFKVNQGLELLKIPEK